MTAFVLLSGGIDSSTALALAVKNHSSAKTTALLVNYGQRHRRELEYADRQCMIHAVEHHTIDLSAVVPATLLTSDDPIPDKTYDQIEGVSPAFVPYRNGLMLSAAAAYAVSMMADDGTDKAELYFGAHAEDAHAWAYPDCTPEFSGAQAAAIYVGTYHKLRLIVPFQHFTKDAIIKLGQQLKVDYASTWSCYAGGAAHCGKCPTCHARKAAFVKAGVRDPTVYAAK
jgi:7-cyano-7-deazaguanine synthase